MIVAALKLDLEVPGVASLKGKRKIVLGLKDRMKSRFNVAVAEVDSQDLWQRAGLGVVAVGNDERFLQSKMDKLMNLVESNGQVEVLSAELEFIHLGQGWG